MTYLHWLLLASAVFIVLERLFPWRRAQSALRPGWLRDVGFLAINGHLFSAWTAGLNVWLATSATAALEGLGVSFPHPLAGAPWLAQFVAYFLLSDFLQWCIHNLLHRVPALWAFHKVHHAITELDWIGNFRFHWMEIVVYKTLQWLPLAMLGAGIEVLLPVAVFGTFWGFFNHANLNVGLGPLGYVFNNPRMHEWHHDISDEGGPAKNFGIVLSLWDWLFGTAYWPRRRSPGRIGYPGMDEMPQGLLGEVLWPLTRRT